MKGRRLFLQFSGSWIGLVGLSLVGCDSSTGDRSPISPELPITLNLESSAFTSGELIPAKYTCDGENASPPLHWNAPPEGTQSLALIVDDPDAPGQTFVHWVLYDLPAETRQLSEAIPTQPILVEGGVQGKNDFGRYGYGGPCPPGGTHRYFFRLYALDKLLNLTPGIGKREAIAAIEGHILARGELMGRYTR